MLQHPKNHRHLGEGNWSSVPCHGFALTFLSVYDIEGLYNVFTNDTWKYLNMSNDFIFNSLPVMDRLIYFMSLFSSSKLHYGVRRCGRHCHHEPWIWWGFPSWQHLKKEERIFSLYIQFFVVAPTCGFGFETWSTSVCPSARRSFYPFFCCASKWYVWFLDSFSSGTSAFHGTTRQLHGLVALSVFF